jgi:hypothetical protein
MAKRRKRSNKSAKRRSRKMPDGVLAHFLAKTIQTAKKRRITPKLYAYR